MGNRVTRVVYDDDDEDDDLGFRRAMLLDLAAFSHLGGFLSRQCSILGVSSTTYISISVLIESSPFRYKINRDIHLSPEKILLTFGPFLKLKSQNPHATILTLFLNWVHETITPASVIHDHDIYGGSDDFQVL